MNNAKYAKAYTEVLEIIKYFPQDEYSKIPGNLIEYYKNNMDKNYNFSIDPGIALREQNVSREAFALIISIFRDYFATDKQKETLNRLLIQNQDKRDAELREKYDPDDVFKNDRAVQEDEQHLQQESVETGVTIVTEEKWYQKLFNLIRGFFHWGK